MRRSIELDPGRLLPSRSAVLGAQGIPPGADPPPHVLALHEAAVDRYRELARPRALLAPIAHDEFVVVFAGEGRNQGEPPLATVFPRAARLALFAATLGAGLSDEIASLFARRELALGAMLDALASEAAELAAEAVARSMLDRLRAEGAIGADATALPYSPGYCGWDITGQRALFGALGPDEIGIELNASCLMTPLKSVSGVVIVGEEAIHDPGDDFDVCRGCETMACRERIPVR